MKFLIPALVLSSCLPAAFSQEQIIPKPAEITVFQGKPAQLTPASAIITTAQDKSFLHRARQLQQMLSKGTGLPLPLKRPGKRRKMPPASSSKRTRPWPRRERKPTPSNPPPRESFFPQPMPKAFLRGAKPGPDDARHLPRRKGGQILHPVEYFRHSVQHGGLPAFSWRALMIDEARHFSVKRPSSRLSTKWPC